MTHVSFLGVPVEGDIHYGDKRPDQRPLSELEPLIRALLDDPEIHDFGWTQYTPYFNDGDPCVFDANGFWVRTQADVAPATAVNDDWLLPLLNRLVQMVSEEYAPPSTEWKQTLLDGVLALELGPPGHDDDDDDDDDEEDGGDWSERFGLDYGHPTLGKATWNYQRSPGLDSYKHLSGYEGSDQERFMRCWTLSQAIEDGAFNDVLLNTFGDHAEIHVTKDKILVSHYEHD